MAIRATDERFLALLRGYIGRYGTPEKPERYVLFSADCGIVRTIAGGKQLRGRCSLYVNTLLVFGGRLQEEMAGRFISMLRDLATSNSNEFMRVRAAGLQFRPDETVLLPSAPNPHLPALAGSCLRRGARFVGDEIVSIDPVLGHAHPVDLPLLIDSTDLPLFPELDREPSRGRASRGGAASTPRRPVSTEEFGASLGVPAPVRWIALPVFEEGARSHIVPIAASEALFGITRALLNLHVWNERALILAGRILENAVVARLVVGSLPEAAAALAEWASEDGHR